MKYNITQRSIHNTDAGHAAFTSQQKRASIVILDIDSINLREKRVQEQAPDLVDADLEGELLKGCYQIDRRVGSGGMTWVYKATHTALLETVAVKILFAQHATDRHLRERFLREARLQAKVKHPHIVRVTDFIEERGVVGLVQEWIGGGDLQEWAEAQGLPLPLPTVAALMLPVIEAVAHAHSKSVIHRDLKPANVMLVPQATGLPMPKLADFGLARQQETQGLTKTNSSMGTPLYMAPEQFINAKQVDERADIYSLGVILYQLCSGQMPFVGDLNSLMYQVFQEERLPPPNVPPAISEIILRCIDTSPDVRFPSCKALASALTEAFAQLPATPQKPTKRPPSLPTIDHEISSWDALPSASQLPEVRPTASPQSLANTRRINPPPAQPSDPTPDRPAQTRPMRGAEERIEQFGPPVQAHHPRQPAVHRAPVATPQTSAQATTSRLYPLMMLVLLLLCVGMAAYWWSSKINSTVTISTSKQTLPSPRQVNPLAAPTPIRPLPPPTSPKRTVRSASARPTLPIAPPSRPIVEPAARKLLDQLTRTYGGRAAFAKLKTLYYQCMYTSYRYRTPDTFLTRNFAIFPAFQRIERVGNPGSVKIISPTTATLASAGRTTVLPKQSQRDLSMLHRLQTIEFTDPSHLIGIQLLRPGWHGSDPIHVLQLAHKDGYQATISFTKRTYHIVKRAYLFRSAVYTRYYAKLQKIPIAGTTYSLLWPMYTELYKKGRLLNKESIDQVEFNAPRVRASLFR